MDAPFALMPRARSERRAGTAGAARFFGAARRFFAFGFGFLCCARRSISALLASRPRFASTRRFRAMRALRFRSYDESPAVGCFGAAGVGG